MTNETNEKYSWNPKKRELIIKTRGLDFVELADAIFGDSSFVVKPDDRRDYGEERRLAYAEVDGIKMCLCYTLRFGEYRVISLRQVRNREWRKIKWP